jgi:putative transposase
LIFVDKRATLEIESVMPRIARIVAPGYPHHITQRGNNRLDIFIDDEDRSLYLGLLKHYRDKHGLEILAYCLMSNHIHLVAIPEEKQSLSRVLADAHMRYSQHVNRKYNRIGHLWQGRFFSSILDENHTLAAARYVERNPVRAGLVDCAWDYPWSSARAHIGAEADRLVSTRWPQGDLREHWRGLLVEPGEKVEMDAIRRSTRSGKPTGSKEFIEKMEGLIKSIRKVKKRHHSYKRLINRGL